MAAIEIPQSKSLVCITSYNNNTGKVAHRRSTFANLKLDAAPDNMLTAGMAIFALKSESTYALNTVTESKIVNA